MKRTLPLLLCCLCLAPVRRHEGETLLDLSAWRKATVAAESNMQPRTLPLTNRNNSIAGWNPAALIPSIMPPAPSTNIVRAVPRTNGPQNFTIAFPRTSPTNLYCLMHSVDLKSWTMIRSNMIGVQSTNADVFTTNRGGREFFRLDRQTNFYTVRP